MFDSLKNKLRKVLGTFSEKIKREPEAAKAAPEKEGKLEAEKEEWLEARKLKAGAPEAEKPEAAWQPAPLSKRERLPKPAIQYGGKIIEAPVPERKVVEPEAIAPVAPEAGEKPEKAEKKEEKKKWGFAQILKEKLTTTKISSDKFDELFWDLEIALMENNVAVEVVEKIKEDLRMDIVDQPLPRSRVTETIYSSLKQSVTDLFRTRPIDIIALAKKKKPFVILFLGINGSGKTTTIAKVAKLLQDNSLKPVIAASDTFRAAAIQQLEKHTEILGVKLIRHDYGADPAAVAFDAIKYAENKGLDVVLIDTAGRLHSNINLMDEMKKMIRVAKPDLKIFVGESITGNDCVEQARQFNSEIGIDGIILAKADVDDKGGAAISISFVTQKPIIFLGTGQGYDDLKPFSPDIVVQSLGLEN